MEEKTYEVGVQDGLASAMKLIDNVFLNCDRNKITKKTRKVLNKLMVDIVELKEKV